MMFTTIWHPHPPAELLNAHLSAISTSYSMLMSEAGNNGSNSLLLSSQLKCHCRHQCGYCPLLHRCALGCHQHCHFHPCDQGDGPAGGAPPACYKTSAARGGNGQGLLSTTNKCQHQCPPATAMSQSLSGYGGSLRHPSAKSEPHNGHNNDGEADASLKRQCEQIAMELMALAEEFRQEIQIKRNQTVAVKRGGGLYNEVVEKVAVYLTDWVFVWLLPRGRDWAMKKFFTR